MTENDLGDADAFGCANGYFRGNAVAEGVRAESFAKLLTGAAAGDDGEIGVSHMLAAPPEPHPARVGGGRFTDKVRTNV